jgi:hypothetical protein
LTSDNKCSEQEVFLATQQSFNSPAIQLSLLLGRRKSGNPAWKILGCQLHPGTITGVLLTSPVAVLIMDFCCFVALLFLMQSFNRIVAVATAEHSAIDGRVRQHRSGD